jgi:hypothetical protein
LPLSLSFGEEWEEWGKPDLRDLLASRVEENRADQASPHSSKDNEIVGFAEVKKNDSQQLREEQERFKRFCERYKIPFSLWNAGDPMPEWF